MGFGAEFAAIEEDQKVDVTEHLSVLFVCVKSRACLKIHLCSSGFISLFVSWAFLVVVPVHLLLFKDNVPLEIVHNGKCYVKYFIALPV